MTFTQRMTMHMNGGSDFSLLVYEVFRDGEPTGIQRSRKTSGRPEYLVTADVFAAADGDEFDALETKKVGLVEWLETHATKGGAA